MEYRPDTGEHVYIASDFYTPTGVNLKNQEGIVKEYLSDDTYVYVRLHRFTGLIMVPIDVLESLEEDENDEEY